MSSEQVAQAVRAEQLCVLFQQTPIASAVNVANAVLSVVVLSPAVPLPVLLWWLAAMVAVTLVRLALWLAYRRADAARTGLWGGIGTVLLGVTGGLWGVLGAVLLPGDDAYRVFVVFVIGGMCAGAVATLSTWIPAAIAFILAASLPFAARLVLEEATLYTVLAGMVVIFAAALLAAIRNLNRSFVETVRLRFQLATRTRELDESNARLITEMGERRGAEDSLRQAQKLEAVGQLTGGIAHDFNNLLTVVIGNLEVARAQAGPGSPLAGALGSALGAAERGAALTQRLLAFARRQRLDPRRVDVRALVDGIADLMRRTLGPEVRLEVVCAPDLRPAQADANQLELAILNLAINARDAMPGGGVLRIGIAVRTTEGDAPAELARGEYVVVSVIDTGTGMDELTLARVFEPFFTTKGVGKGSGLGLATVQGFAAQSGGGARVRSRLGHGTSVEIWLPVAAPAAGGTAVASPLPAADASFAARCILVCDDEAEIRSFVAGVLRGRGADVVEAEDAEATLRAVGTRLDQIDVLIVDYAMPGMSGAELARALRRRRRDLKTLMITGHADALSRGVEGIELLAKPFRPAQLVEAVTRLLEGEAAAPARRA